jgi:hypothetical protein
MHIDFIPGSSAPHFPFPPSAEGSDSNSEQLQREIARLEQELEKLSLELDVKKARIEEIDRQLSNGLSGELAARRRRERQDLVIAVENLEACIQALKVKIEEKQLTLEPAALREPKIGDHPFPDNRFDFKIGHLEMDGRVLVLDVMSSQNDPALFELYWAGTASQEAVSKATVFLCAPHEPTRGGMEEHHITVRFDLSSIEADICYLEPGVAASKHTELWGPPIWNRG